MIQQDTPETRDFPALEAFEGAFDWWREAGVDYDFSDEPSSWLAGPEDEEAVTAPSPPPEPRPVTKSPLQRALAQDDAPAIGGDSAAWPDTLEKFHDWWMTEPSLADGALDRRIPPRGEAEAVLMVLTGQPEDGENNELLDAILHATGIDLDTIYLASALPAPMPMPEWQVLANRGLGDIARHHIALARPQRILAIGRAQLALFGIDAARARDPLTLDCNGTSFPLLAAPDFGQLARSAARRKNFWQRWLDWTA